MRFDDAWERFANHLEANDRAVKTRYGYQRDLHTFRNFYERRYNTEWHIEDTTPNDVEDFLQELYAVKNLQPASRNRILHCLRSFYKFLHHRELCPRNPTISVETIRYKRRDRQYLTEREYPELVCAIDRPVIRLATETLWYTGVRISELCGLSIDDVKLNQSIIHVVGKGGYNRDIPIHAALRPKLEAYRGECRRTSEPWERFFATAISGGLSPSYYNAQIHQTTGKLKWDKNVTAHTLRHSFATNLMKAGVHAIVIQRLLGHKSLEVTTQYTHVDMPLMNAAIRLL